MLNHHMTYPSKRWVSRLKGDAAFLDDLIVEGSTKEEILKLVFSDFRTDSTILFLCESRKMSVFFCTSIKYLGLIFTIIVDSQNRKTKTCQQVFRR